MKKVYYLKVILCLVLIMGLFSRCTVYKPVSSHPGEINSGRIVILHKDELIFRLVETDVRHDTLWAKLSNDNANVGKGRKMIVALKPNQEIAQDSDGVLVIPFSQIETVEYYVLDKEKTSKTTMVVIVAGISVFFIMGMISLAVFGF